MESMEYLSERVSELENEVKHLKYLIRGLLELTDFSKSPFTYHSIEHNLTESQVDAIYDLLDQTQVAIKNGEALSHHKFESQIYEIVPARKGDYHFAESIVSTLNKEERYEEVYKYLQKNGMNI